MIIDVPNTITGNKHAVEKKSDTNAAGEPC